MSQLDHIKQNNPKQPIDYNKKLIIGIAGKKYCGKTTLSDLLVKKAEPIGLKIVQYAFGDALKEEISRVYGIAKSDLYSQDGKLKEVIFEMDPTDPRYPQSGKYHSAKIHDDLYSCKAPIRTLLQWYGTEYRRKQDPDYWVNRTQETIGDLLENYDIVVLHDVRFPNEFRMVNSYIHHYHCRLHPYPGYQFAEDTHPSETALDYTGGFDDEYYPKFGIFHLKLIANKIYKDILRPFSISINGETETLQKVSI